MNNENKLSKQFVSWQCRVRQYAVRKDQGRPSSAMQPDLEVKGQCIRNLNVLIVKSDSNVVTRELRFMTQKTRELQSRYDNAIKYLAEYYYQLPQEFDEEMTALFSIESELAMQLITIGQGILHFKQANQQYQLPCTIRDIDPEEEKYQATYWHNYLFNPSLPGRVRVLGFQPDWRESKFALIQNDETQC